MLFNKGILPINNDLYNNNKNDYADVIDGAFYREYRETITENGSFLRNYSFLINTDGISMCSKSNITLNPVYLVINEIPKETRFHIDNVLIAG